MRLLATLDAWSPQTARATAVLREDSPFARRDGLLERTVHAELIAQCFAAGSGACLREAGGTVPDLGYLAALRDMEVLADARVGQPLAVDVRVTGQLGGITVVEGEVHGGDVLLARGQIKVFLPEAEA